VPEKPSACVVESRFGQAEGARRVNQAAVPDDCPAS
jgi:hypothetical protein